MGRRTIGSIWGIEEEDNKSTGSHSSEKREKILSENQCIGAYNKKSLITRTGWQMETYRIPIKNNATSRTKLWDIWQRITCNSGSHYKMEIILVRCYREIWSLDRPWKSQVFLGTTQT